MFTPKELEGLPLNVEMQFKQLESNIMSDIIDRLRASGEITSTIDWQIYRLQQLGESSEFIKKEIQNLLNLSNKEIDLLYKNALEKSFIRDVKTYNLTGVSKSNEIKTYISAIKEQTKDAFKNITQSLGFATNSNGKLQFMPIADFYQKNLDTAMYSIFSGAFDYNTVLKDTVNSLANSGLRTVDYASGWSNRVDVAGRRAVMTGLSQVTGKVNEEIAKEIGTDKFEVTYHVGARPEHQRWQGKVYTKAELASVCGLGKVTGLNGANCYHDYYPLPNGAKSSYTEQELEDLNQKENTPTPYKGKEYTTYQALQRQRQLETSIRACREKISLLNKGNATKEILTQANAKYKILSAEYVNFSRKMSLPQQRERISLDGRGRF